MSEYLIQGASMTAIADAVRSKAGVSGAMTPAEIAEAIAAIEINAPLPSGITEVKTGSFLLPERAQEATFELWEDNSIKGFWFYANNNSAFVYPSDQKACLFAGFYTPIAYDVAYPSGDGAVGFRFMAAWGRQCNDANNTDNIGQGNFLCQSFARVSGSSWKMVLQKSSYAGMNYHFFPNITYYWTAWR